MVNVRGKKSHFLTSNSIHLPTKSILVTKLFLTLTDSLRYYFGAFCISIVRCHKHFLYFFYSSFKISIKRYYIACRLIHTFLKPTDPILVISYQ